MIYLIRTYGKEKESILKIGFASDLERRMSQYFYANPLFEFVSSREGDELLEKLLHCYLYHKGFQYKVDGKLNEWFIDDPEVIRIFDISIEDLEKELWENRDKVFDLKGKLKNSLDYKLFEYLYQKNKEDFIGEKYILDENNKIIETSAKDIDIIFWEMYFLKNKSNMRERVADIKSISDKIVSDFLDNHFYRTGKFEERMKLYCEFCDTYGSNQDIMSSLDYKIKDSKYKGFYIFYGSKGCKAKEYRKIELEKEFQDALKEDVNMVYNSFIVGEKYTRKEIKSVLSKVYSSQGLNKSPKASDLENYFELSPVLLTNPKTKKREHGYKIVKRK